MKEESYKVKGEDVVKKVKALIKEGNVRRIIIKNDADEVVIEFPVTIGVVGLLVSPALIAVGAIAAVLTNCTIVVQKK